MLLKMGTYLAVVLILSTAPACQQDWRDCRTRCAAEPDPGECDAAFPRYYFDRDAGECREFIWGGCDGVVPFATLEACKDCGCHL